MSTYVSGVRYEVRYVGPPYGDSETGHKVSARFLSLEKAEQQLTKQRKTAKGYGKNSRIAEVSFHGRFLRWIDA
jgi:hypothetical protein